MVNYSGSNTVYIIDDAKALEGLLVQGEIQGLSIFEGLQGRIYVSGRAWESFDRSIDTNRVGNLVGKRRSLESELKEIETTIQGYSLRIAAADVLMLQTGRKRMDELALQCARQHLTDQEYSFLRGLVQSLYADNHHYKLEFHDEKEFRMFEDAAYRLMDVGGQDLLEVFGIEIGASMNGNGLVKYTGLITLMQKNRRPCFQNIVVQSFESFSSNISIPDSAYWDRVERAPSAREEYAYVMESLTPLQARQSMIRYLSAGYMIDAKDVAFGLTSSFADIYPSQLSSWARALVNFALSEDFYQLAEAYGPTSLRPNKHNVRIITQDREIISLVDRINGHISTTKARQDWIRNRDVKTAS